MNKLRAAAEAKLAQGAQAEAPAGPADDLLHELQVHQIELEMQNEALRQTQIALEASRDRYVDLYEFAPVGYLTITESGLIAEINLAGARLLGVNRRRLIGRRFGRFVAPADSNFWYGLLPGALQQSDRQTCELAMKRGDGSSFHARLDYTRSAGEQQAPSIRIALTDVSVQKHTEEELRIAAIAFEAQEGMIVTDTAGVILRVNRAFTNLTGYSAEEAIGKTPALLKSGRQDATFYHQMWQVLRSRGYWQGEMWNRRKDGKIYVEWLTISAVAAADGATTHYVGTFSEITANKEAEAEIHRLAYYDPLTLLPNRRLLHDRLRQALAVSRRSRHYAAVLFLDLDNFKTLNDTRGHDVGDQLLQEAARRLQGEVRAGDTLSRLGGDEFVLVLENLSTVIAEAAVEARQVGEKVRIALALPYDLDGYEFHCTASLGITLFQNHNEPIETLLKHADLALYKAKNAGRNTLRFFDPAMQTALDKRTALEAELRLAVTRQEFILYYQPQVEVDRGRIVSAEALIRWCHPSAGMISPDDFIPLAEETGLIIPIGAWVIETACRQLKSWQDEGFTDLGIAVNLSARQFQHEAIADLVSRLLRENNLQAQYLELEITESAAMQDPQETIDMLHRLAAIGVRISLDDFGVGYSSLNYLKRFPINTMKIDQSFVQDITSDANDAAIAFSVINLAHSLKHTVVAEGVETEAQLSLLRRHRCDRFQGYFFSRPVPADKFADLLRAGETLKIVEDNEEEQGRTLLIVDDEEYILTALKRLLRRDGYRILTANGAADAFRLLALNKVQVIVSDQRMPELTGTEFFGRVKDMYPDTIRIVLSGYTELKSVIDAVNRGAIYKFLTKPWDDAALREHIRDAFLFYASKRDKFQEIVAKGDG